MSLAKRPEILKTLEEARGQEQSQCFSPYSPYQFINKLWQGGNWSLGAKFIASSLLSTMLAFSATLVGLLLADQQHYRAAERLELNQARHTKVLKVERDSSILQRHLSKIYFVSHRPLQLQDEESRFRAALNRYKQNLWKVYQLLGQSDVEVPAFQDEAEFRVVLESYDQ